MEKIRLFKNLERLIAHTDEVESALGDAAFVITTKARANLAKHRKTGSHKVTQSKGIVDHFVNLEGEFSLSVEFGHHHKLTGEFVPGLHILTGALE